LQPYLFNHLRGDKGLGYIVNTRHELMENILLNRIIVVGKKYNPIEMNEMIKDSLKLFKHFVEGLSNEQFELKREHT